MFYSTQYESPFDTLTMVSDGENLIGLWSGGQKYFAATIKGTLEGTVEVNPDVSIFAITAQWLDDYFAGKQPALSRLSLAPTGGEFRQMVWEFLCEIPYGQCTTYGAIAKKVATRMNKKKMSSQAIGGAVGHNPIGIIIPCHRVVGSNGSLTGYAGGIDKKIKLLELEGVNTSRFFIPTKGTAL